MRRGKARKPNIEALERRQYVFELRRTGATYHMILNTLRQHPTWSTRLPSSYDVRRVHNDVMLTIKRIETETAESVHATRQQEIDRLDRMLLGVWSRAQNGDDRAIASVVSIMTRRARYIPGLEAPQAIAPTTPDGTESYKPLSERVVNDTYVRDVAELLAQYGLFQLGVGQPAGAPDDHGSNGVATNGTSHE